MNKRFVVFIGITALFCLSLLSIAIPRAHAQVLQKASLRLPLHLTLSQIVSPNAAVGGGCSTFVPSIPLSYQSCVSINAATPPQVVPDSWLHSIAPNNGSNWNFCDMDIALYSSTDGQTFTRVTLRSNINCIPTLNDGTLTNYRGFTVSVQTVHEYFTRVVVDASYQGVEDISSNNSPLQFCC